MSSLDSLDIKFDTRRIYEPAHHGLRAWKQGQVIFIGEYWLEVSEAKKLRDWLDLALA